MVRAMQPGGRGGEPSPTGLADVIEIMLDQGLVIDAYLRLSLVGIEVLTIDARIVVASVDTYLRFAEAVSRLDISREKEGLPGLVGDSQHSSAIRKTKGVLRGWESDSASSPNPKACPLLAPALTGGDTEMAAPAAPEGARGLGQSAWLCIWHRASRL